ncbi:MAG TPA: cellulase family glycosylhydrolase [Gaiellaceae bacterium]
MSKWIRATCALLFAAVALPVAAQAAPRMPIGFYDDASFRWSNDRLTNLAAAATAGASVIHTNANWATVAPTRPANALNGDDPAYQLADLDQLVAASAQNGMRVMVTIVGTPKWANGGQTANHMPRKLSDLTAFARMLATRYNGHNGHGTVSLWSVWNEPNLQLFLTPQFSGKTIVSPGLYAKLYKAAYAGIKVGNPSATIAIGETSPEGRDKPIAIKGQGQSVAPGTFARLLARTKGLKFNAWAEHPYPTATNGKALGLARYPNVTLPNLPLFEKNLRALFHRQVPIWITEYGHQTKPAQPKGVTYAQQATYAKQALTYAKNDPNVQMFVWFTLRDSATNPWKSGLEQANGTRKPSFASFASLARSIRGTVQTVRTSRRPKVVVYVPTIAYYSPVGSNVGITYSVRDAKGHYVSRGEPVGLLSSNQSVTFTPNFVVRKGNTYTVTAVVNDASGHTESVSAVLRPTS